MRSIHRKSSHRGFTIFELLIIMAIMGVMATMFAPNFLRLVHQAKLTGSAQELEVTLRSARQAAIRHNVQAVVQIDQVNEEIIYFVDVDGVNIGDPPDGIFNPIAGRPHRSTDWEVSRQALPNTVDFAAPGADPFGDGAISGFDNSNSLDRPGLPDDVAIFEPRGSVVMQGAFRLADPFDNYLEVRVAPPLTGRVSTRKFSDVDSEWHIRNETGKPWKWK